MGRTTLIAGCGRLGLRIAALLQEAGGEVLGLRRDPRDLPEGIIPVAADLSAPLTSPLPPADALVIALPPSGFADLRAPLQHLRDAVPALPVRTVLISSTRVLEGYDASRPLTEADPPRPRSERARRLVEGEEAARELFDAIVLRAAGIYGPGRDRLIRAVREQRPVEHDRRTNRIYEQDLARAVVALLEAADPPRLLHAVDAAPAPLGEVVGHIAAQLDLPVPPRAVPDPGAGTVLDGAALHRLLGHLEVPDHRAGYAAILAGESA